MPRQVNVSPWRGRVTVVLVGTLLPHSSTAKHTVREAFTHAGKGAAPSSLAPSGVAALSTEPRT